MNKVTKVLKKVAGLIKKEAEPSKKEILKKILYAKSVAIIGASEKESSVGCEITKNLLESFKGNVFPVNPKYETILGQKAYKSVLDIKKTVDFAVIVVPAKAVLGVVEECAKAKISGVVVISAGFKEIGQEGALLEKQLLDIVNTNKMALIGPNCLGVLNLHNNLNASFSPVAPKKAGKVAFVSQSGALVCGIINLMEQENLNCSQIVSIGNQTDVDFLDLFELWEDDDNIEIILAYVEGIEDSDRFKKVCSRISSKKPIIMLKSGRSAKGGSATASHTGALAGDDVALDALIKSAGVIREYYLRDFINTAKMFNSVSDVQGHRLGILTNAGGPAIIATDTANDVGIEVVDLSEETKNSLRENLPAEASVKNPVDIIASASLEQFVKSAEILLKSDEIDTLLVIYLYITQKNDIALAQELEKLREKYPSKAIVGVFQTTDEFFEELKEQNISIPIFKYGVDAIKPIKKLVEYYQKRTNEAYTEPKFEVDTKTAKRIIATYKKEKRSLLTTYDSLNFFKCFDLPLAKFELVKTLEETYSFAEKVGYPLVLKISSREVSHKTDVGGVVVGINNKTQLGIEWKSLQKRLKDKNLLETL
ncbi:MAG: CoA-binding protein, partial [Clostridia bacterium]|nr:CoA-binding protein [Clostridia bacterium]